MATITMDQMYNEWKRTADKQTETESRLSVIETMLNQGIGAQTDAAQTDPATSATMIALLKGLLTKLADPATQATLAQVKAVLDTINTNTDGLETLLTAIRDTAGIKKITDPVDISDRSARALGKVSADDGAIAALGALAAAAVTDPAATASVIALLKGLLKQLQGAGSGSMPVTLTGRNVSVVEVILVNAVAITDTLFRNTGEIDLSKYKSVQILVKSTLDQPVSISLRTPTPADILHFWTGSAFAAANESIPVGANKSYLLDSRWTFLKNGPSSRPNKFSLSYNCSVAPTTGSLSIYLLGVLN